MCAAENNYIYDTHAHSTHFLAVLDKPLSNWLEARHCFVILIVFSIWTSTLLTDGHG